LLLLLFFYFFFLYYSITLHDNYLRHGLIY
jgi:hypothetical protein